MQAITTRVHAPTNTLPMRVSATAAAGRHFFSWDHALTPLENHRRAAELFARMYGWTTDAHGTLATGMLHTGDYAHVFHN